MAINQEAREMISNYIWYFELISTELNTIIFINK